MRFLIVGDILGKPGRKALKYYTISHPHNFDVLIANVENSAGGFGINKRVYEELKSMGVDVMTSGNHIWDKKEALEFINAEDLLRPANYPPNVPGKGYGVYEKKGTKFAVINLMGRIFLDPHLENPFLTFDRIFEEVSKQTPIMLVDFHGEATSEKYAFGLYVDGRASLVFGTHTHVPTADQNILKKGTGFVCDVGMSGCWYSAIGMKAEDVIKKFLTGLPQRYEVEEREDVVFNALLVSIDERSGKCLSINRVQKYITREELKEL